MKLELRRRFHRYNPSREIDYRWRDVHRLLDADRRPTRRTHEPEVLAAYRYAKALYCAPEHERRRRIRRCLPKLVKAHKLSRSPGPLQWEVQARILAGQTDEEIAARCPVPAGVIGWYEAVFFTVRDRLKAGDWIRVRAVGLNYLTGQDPQDLGTTWRFFAYAAGVDVLDITMAVTLDRELPAWVHEIDREKRPGFAERLRCLCQLLIEATLRPLDEEMVRVLLLRRQLLERQWPSTPPATDKAATSLLEEALAEGPDEMTERPADEPASRTTRTA